jgi:FHA domain
MIRCNNCGTDNLDGSEYCDECGMKLAPATASAFAGTSTGSQSSTAVPPPGMPSASPPRPLATATNTSNVPLASPTVSSRDGAPSFPPGGAPPAAAYGASPGMGGSFTKSTGRAKLIIQRGGTIGKEFLLTDTESNIGRWDADGGIFPDVDLDQDDPEAKVSRRHARIIHQSGQYLIEDLGSTNGTFINRGRRLLPGNRHPLNNGDEIIVGKTFLKFVMD